MSSEGTFDGPVLFRLGFRPFFLGAGLWAPGALIAWLAVVQVGGSIPTAFSPAGWHGHELVFGYGGAVIAGFLLTAIPNWTGRPPLQGWPLSMLFATWLIGRAAMAGSAVIGPGIAAVLPDVLAGPTRRGGVDRGGSVACCGGAWPEYVRRFAVDVRSAVDRGILRVCGSLWPNSACRIGRRRLPVC